MDECTIEFLQITYTQVLQNAAGYYFLFTNRVPLHNYVMDISNNIMNLCKKIKDKLSHMC